MMSTSMCFSRMPATVAIGITAVTLSVHTTITRNTMVTGRIVRNAAIRSRPRYTCGTQPTSIISRNFRIRPRLSRPSAQHAGKSLLSAKTNTQHLEMISGVRSVRINEWKKKFRRTNECTIFVAIAPKS